MKTTKLRAKDLFQIVGLACLLSFSMSAQLKEVRTPNVYSEGRFYLSDKTVYCDAIVVKFKTEVIRLSDNLHVATIDNVTSDNVKGLLNEIQSKHGDYRIIKQIPSFRYGDVVRVNKRTGQQVAITDLSQLFTIRFSEPLSLDWAISKFEDLEEVEYVHQPISVMYFVEPNDSIYQAGEQWDLQAVDAPHAWNITKGDPDIPVAIIDDGTLYNHPELYGKVVEGDFDVGEHGTYVAGVAGAKTNNGIGVASLGWDVSLTTWGNGDWDVSSLAYRISVAAGISGVINMSWGTLKYATLYDITEEHPNCPQPEKWIGAVVPTPYYSIQQAVGNAISQGVICVASAGNSSKNAGYGPNPELCDPMWLPYPAWPAQYSGVIAVSGTMLVDDEELFKDGYNYGSFVDVAAPGANIWTTKVDGGYYNPNGTSFSAPKVSALAAMILALNPYYSVNDVTSIMTSTCDKIDSDRYAYDGNGWNSRLGYGRINAYKALAEANGAPESPSNLAITNTTNTPIHLSWDANEEPDVSSYEVWRNEVTSQSGWQLIGTPTTNSFTDNDYIWASIYGNETLQYKVRAKDVVGNLSDFSSVVQTTGEPGFKRIGTTPDKDIVPSEYTLFQNYPNPFNPETEIMFGLPEPSMVKLTILDMLGREIATVSNQEYPAGYHRTVWRGVDASGIRVGSGVYFCKIEVFGQIGKTFTEVVKMTLTK